MAKVSGPLMSMSASGAFAGTLVYTRWKGRPCVRQLVVPANPQSTGQETTRNAIRVAGAGQRFANLTAEIRAGETLTDKELLIASSPSGQAWNGFLVKSEIGASQVNYDAATAAYAALSAPEKAAWDAAAEGVTPAFVEVPQYGEGGVAGTPMTTGEVFYHYVYGLYMAGLIDTAPGAVPPVYA